MTVRQPSVNAEAEERLGDAAPVRFQVAQDVGSSLGDGALEAFRRGDATVLEQVYWHHVDYVERIVRHGLASWRQSEGGGPPRDADDLLQDIFARAFSPAARQSFDGRREFRPYLAAIARNVLIDLFRASRIDDRLVYDELPENEVAVDDPQWAEPRLLAIVKDYVAHLPPELEGVYHQRYVLGVSQEIAARSLSLTRQRLRTLERKLRARLARELKRAGIKEAL